MLRALVPLLCTLLASGCGPSDSDTNSSGDAVVPTSECPSPVTRERFGLPLNVRVGVMFSEGDSLYVAGGFGLLRSSRASFPRVGDFRHVRAFRALADDTLLIASDDAPPLAIADRDGTITRKCSGVIEISTMATAGKRIVVVDVAGALQSSTDCTHWTRSALNVVGVVQAGSTAVAWESTRCC